MTTAFCYDPAERAHDLQGHSENRRRLEGVIRLFLESGLVSRLNEVRSTPISDERLRRVHTPDHIATIETTAQSGGGFLDSDTYVQPGSAHAARIAAGGLVNLTLEVLDGRANNGFAIIRPPGHHALADQAMGFCLFANVAVAARAAQAERNLERVLVVDFDVHHGNGTEAIFYDDPSVLVFSTHQYPYYPGTGAINDVGIGEGRGFTLNVPLPAGVGDAGYAAVWERVLWPAARRYRPQLILVSAGFDAHWADPLAHMQLSLAGYAHLIRELHRMAAELCEGKLVLALEGGYHLDVLPYAVLNAIQILSDPTTEALDPFGPSQESETNIDGLLSTIIKTHDLGAS